MPPNEMAVVEVPLQTVWLEGAVTTGAGVTVNGVLAAVVPHSLVTESETV